MSRSDCASAQSDQDLHCPPLASLGIVEHNEVEYTLNGSNPDGSFTLDDSNSFFSPYKILPIAQENKFLGIFSYFMMELYVACTQNRLIEAILMSTLNIQLLCRKSKRFP